MTDIPNYLDRHNMNPARLDSDRVDVPPGNDSIRPMDPASKVPPKTDVAVAIDEGDGCKSLT